jgi:hypothetical protein
MADKQPDDKKTPPPQGIHGWDLDKLRKETEEKKKQE